MILSWLVYGIALGLIWALQMVAMWLVRNIADLTLPAFGDRSKKVFVMVVASALLDFIPFVGWVLGIVVYWRLMMRWFDADIWAILYVGVARFFVGMWALLALEAGIAKL